VVAVSAVTTLLTPYLIKLADPLSTRLAQAMPQKMASVFGMYSIWLDSLQPQGDRAELSRIIRRILLQVVVNLALVVAIFIIGGYFAEALGSRMSAWVADAQVQKAIVWGGALLVSLPFLIATYRKLHALSMLLAEISVRPEWAGSHSRAVRRVIAEVIPVVSIIGIMLMIAALSSRILPPTNLLILVLAAAAALVLMLWQRFVKLHSKLQIALRETMEQQPDENH
jgi:CPA2 family monovalent cation:H+ antiporter-2